MVTTFTRFCNVYDSSNITKVTYDPKGQRLGISFTQANGSVQDYIYKDVPREVFGAIVSAESVGTEFHKHNLKGVKQ